MSSRCSQKVQNNINQMPNVAIAGSNCYHFGFLTHNKMTKKELAKQIIETITNNYDMQQDHENEPAIMAFLELLEPKDKEAFAQWGFPNQQSSVNDCW